MTKKRRQATPDGLPKVLRTCYEQLPYRTRGVSVNMNTPSLYEKVCFLLSCFYRSIRLARARGQTAPQMLLRAARGMKNGPKPFVRRVVAFSIQPDLKEPADTSHYERWLRTQATLFAATPSGPRLSVVMPTLNTPERFLREAIASVQAQTYLNWELCIVDDASESPHVRELLKKFAREDPRILFSVRSSRGGISEATNQAIRLASGDYLAFLDHDDVLAKDALSAVTAKILETNADIVYTDHDYLGEDGRHRNPFFKPGWSPDLFLAQMYLGHLVVVRRSLLWRAGFLRPECDGSQDYDLVLRCVRAGARVEHVPGVLYHWRQHSGSTAGNHDSKPYAHEAGKRAIQDHLDSAHAGARVEDGRDLFCYDVRYPLPNPAPMASVIIPTRDRIDLLSACVQSILQNTAYERYEIVIVDNQSVEPRTHAWLEQEVRRDARMRVVRAAIPFNWSRLNNLGASEARGEVLIFLNNDTEALTPDWMQRLVENAVRPQIGVCGPLLLYPDGTIQHAGVVLGLGGWAGHLYRGAAAVHDQRFFVSPVLRRNVLAVTGACMAMATETFRRLGGFDESFVVCGSDVEICLRAHREGLRNVYVPEARLIHHESKSRKTDDIPDVDFRRSAEEYGVFRTGGDPLYNPNLDPTSLIPELRGGL